MPNTLKLIEEGAEFAGFGEDLKAIRTIVGLKEAWDKLAVKPQGFADVKALLGAVLDKARAQEVADAFKALGLEEVPATLIKLLEKVEKTFGEVPKWVQTLFEPISSFNAGNVGALLWNPLKVDEKVTIDEEHKILFGVSGTAGLGATAWSNWPDEDGTPLLRLDAHGKIGFTAGGEVKLPGGALGLTIEAGAEANLFYYYKVAGGGLYVVELAERLPDLPNPFQLGGLWTEKDRHGFSGARFDFKGGGSATVEVSLAYSGALAGIPADLDASIKVGAKFERGYSLTARPSGTGLYVTMQRKRLKAESLAASIKLGVGFPALAAKVQAVLTKAVAVWDKELKAISPFLSPGTYLQGLATKEISAAAERLIQNETLRKAVESDLQGVFGIDSGDKSDVVDWLTDTLRGAIDAKSSKLFEKADVTKVINDAVDAVWGELTEVIPSFGAPTDELLAVAAGVRDEIQAEVKAQLKGLITTVKGEFDTLLDKAFDELKKDGKAAGKLLAKAGAASKDAVEELDDLLKGVREALEHYSKILHEVTDKAQEAIKQKISITLHAENESSEQLDVRIAGTFEKLTDGTRETFRKFATGDLDTAWKIATGLEAPADFDLDEKKSRRTLTLMRKGSKGLDVLGFGLSASFSTERNARVELEIDGNGNLQLDTEGQLIKRFSGNGSTREVSFADSVSLAMARTTATAASPPRIELGVSVTYKDKELEAEEMEAFAGTLTRAGLITAAIGAEGERLLASWTAKDEDGPRADVSAKLWFEDSEIGNLLRLDPAYREGAVAGQPKPLPLTPAAQRGIFDLVWAEMTNTDPKDKGIGERFNLTTLKEVMEIMKENPALMKEYFFDLEGKSDDKPESKNCLDMRSKFVSGNGYEQPRMSYALAVWKQLHGIIDVIDYAGRAYQSTPAGVEAQAGEWTPKQYLAVQERILSGSQGWLATGGSIFKPFMRKDMHPRTVSLMRILKLLAQAPAKPAKLTLVDRREEAKPVTVLVTQPPSP